MGRILPNLVYALTRFMSGLLYTISFSNRVMLLNISLSSDSAMAGL